MSDNGAQSLLEVGTGPHFDNRDHSHKDAASSGADNNKTKSADLVADLKEDTSTSTRKWYKCWPEAVEKGTLESATPTTPAQLDTDKATTEIAQKKTTAQGVERSVERSRHKRGGQRHSGPRSSSFWRRVVGRAKSPHHEIGDFVEAEWMNTGWWYVGYVKGKEAGGGKKKGVYRVAFADGDEADVRGEGLRKLGFSGRTKGSAGILPGHVPIADLGTRAGRLYRNLNTFCTQNSEEEQRGNISTFQDRNEEKVGQESTQVPLDASGGSKEQAGVDASLQRESSSNIQDRPKQGEQVVRRGSTPSLDSTGKWWETGTQYAFQPHLDPDAAWSGGAPGGGDVRVSVMHAAHDATAESVFSYAGARSTLYGAASRNEKLLHALQPAGENKSRGRRIYFLV